MFWSVSGNFSIQLALLITSIILGRLLDPEDYGIIGMVSIFTAVAQSILDSGFGTALIQKKDVDDVDSSSIFYFNLFMGIILVILFHFAAPLISEFYNQPILVPITRIISYSFIINAFGLVQTSLLTKSLNFHQQFKAAIVSVIGSSIVGVFMATQNLGVWSLVGQLLSRYFINTLMLWGLSAWRPKLTFSIDSLKSMFPFGSRLLATGLLETIFNNIYQTFIGKFYSISQLGFYSKALTLETSISKATSTSLSKVTLAAMSPYQDDESMIKKYYKNSIKLTMFIHAPLMIGLLGIADPLIRFLLTNKWAPMIPFFQLFCVIGFFLPLNNLNINLLFVKGETNKYLMLQIIQKIIIIFVILITYKLGINALILGQIFTALFSLILLYLSTRRILEYPLIEQIKDLSHIFIFSFIMVLFVLIINFFGIQNQLLKLIIQIITGITVYYILNVLNHSWELDEIKIIINNFISTLRNRINK